MKQRIINLVLLVCCMGFISSANENSYTCKTRLQVPAASSCAGKTTGQTGFDLSPLGSFMLTI